MRPGVSRALTSLLGLFVIASRAAGEPSEGAATCVSTHESGLSAQREGKLTRAYERFAECTLPACPGPVREECAQKVKQLNELIPTVVLSARVRGGAELSDTSVEVDSRPLASRLDGRAHRLDPGPHSFRFQSAGRPDRVVSVVLGEGDRLRRVEAVWEPASPKIPVSVWVLAGVGAVGALGFTYFGISGLSEESELEKCKPTCDKSQSDSLRQKYLFADISLAVALVGIGGATYFYVSSRSSGGDAEPASGRNTFVGLRGSF
jgi:hypothetical protein